MGEFLFEQLVRPSVEYQHWGLGWTTLKISFLVTVVLNVVEGLFIWSQMRKIHIASEAESVSNQWNCYFGFLLIVLGLYGLMREEVSGAMLFEAPLGLCYIPLMILLYKHKGFTKGDSRVLWGSVAMVPAFLFICWLGADQWIRDSVVGFFALFAVYALYTMPRELWKTGKRGQLEIGLVILIIINISAWMVYGFAAFIPLLMIVTPIALIFPVAALWLWYRAQPEPVAA